MRMRLYSLYDSIAKEFAPVFSAKTDALASRSVRNLLSKVPNFSDFTLHFVGEFDHDDGRLHLCTDDERDQVIDFNLFPEKVD